jgi:hypothetical protein
VVQRGWCYDCMGTQSQRKGLAAQTAAGWEPNELEARRAVPQGRQFLADAKEEDAAVAGGLPSYGRVSVTRIVSLRLGARWKKEGAGSLMLRAQHDERLAEHRGQGQTLLGRLGGVNEPPSGCHLQQRSY